MNSMQTAVSKAIANPVRVSKSSKRENRKPAVPEVKAPVAAAPAAVKPVAKVEKVQTPETIFTVADRAKLEASPWGLKLTAHASDPNVHLNHTALTLDAILANKLSSFTLTKLVEVLDRDRFEGDKPKSDKLLRAYVRDCVQTLLGKTSGAITTK